MSVTPYITFAGNCAAAIQDYQQLLGAELCYQITFGEMPKNDQQSGCPPTHPIPDAAIAHAHLRIADSNVMMSDGSLSENLQYSGITLMLETQDILEGKRWFDSLAAEGRIEMAWQETFWALGFGRVTDKYGVPWLINVAKQQPMS